MKKAVFALSLCLALGCVSHEARSTEHAFAVGFGRRDITPALGIPIGGYGAYRFATKVLDPLEAVAVAFSDGTRTAVVCAVDNLHLNDPTIATAKTAFAAATGLPEDALFLHSTHSHMSGETNLAAFNPKKSPERYAAVKAYHDLVVARVAEACAAAVADLAPAALSCARTEVDRVTFCRRYLMKDGKVHTNPGVGNPEIVKCVRAADRQVQLLRIDRKGAPAIAVVNFQTHPDVIGGDNISGDWPAILRRQLETSLPDVKCLFVNGAQGDVNHICVDPKPGETNGMHDDEDCPRGYDRAFVIGRKLAGAVLGVWGECVPLEAGEVRFGQKQLRIPTNKVTPEELAEAKRLIALVRAGKRDQIPYKAMEYTTVMAGAHRKVSLEHAADSFEMPVSAVVIGRAVAFCGFPGEPFNAIGEATKAKSPFALTMPACLTNGSRSYFPSAEAFAGGGYEAAQSRFSPDVERALVDGQLSLIESL